MRGRERAWTGGVVVCTAEPSAPRGVGLDCTRSLESAALTLRKRTRGPGMLDLVPEMEQESWGSSAFAAGLGVLRAGPPAKGGSPPPSLLAEACAPRDLHGATLGRGPQGSEGLLGSCASPPAVCCQVWEKLAWRGGAGGAWVQAAKTEGREDSGIRERHLGANTNKRLSSV